MFDSNTLNWAEFHRHLLFLLIQQPISPIIGQHRPKMQFIGKKLAVGYSFLFARSFELCHLFWSYRHTASKWRRAYPQRLSVSFRPWCAPLLSRRNAGFHPSVHFANFEFPQLADLRGGHFSFFYPSENGITADVEKYQRSTFKSISLPSLSGRYKNTKKVYHKTSRMSMIFVDLCGIKSFFSDIQREVQ